MDFLLWSKRHQNLDHKRFREDTLDLEFQILWSVIAHTLEWTWSPVGVADNGNGDDAACLWGRQWWAGPLARPHYTGMPHYQRTGGNFKPDAQPAAADDQVELMESGITWHQHPEFGRNKQECQRLLSRVLDSGDQMISMGKYKKEACGDLDLPCQIWKKDNQRER